jgi:hypothetical protein
LPAGLIVAIVAMLPLPPPAPHDEPVVAAHVQVTPVMAAGIASAIAAPVAVDGPAFETVIVYVMAVPGMAVAVPSVLLIERSPLGESVSVSVAVLLAAFDSVTPEGTFTVAILTSEPVEPDAIVAIIVNVAVPPTKRFTVVLIAPVPLVSAHAEPLDAEHVHVAPVTPDGRLSITVAPVTGFGPALLATIVYVVVEPGVALVTPSVFVIARSVAESTVTLAVELLFAGEGSVTPDGAVTVAVFTTVPAAVDTESVPVTV